MLEEEGEDVSKELLAYMTQAFNVSRERDASRAKDDDDSDDDSSVGSRSTGSRSSFFSATTMNDDDQNDKADEVNNLFDPGSIIKHSKIAIFLTIVLVAMAGSIAAAFLIKDNENQVYDEHTDEIIAQIVKRSQSNLDLAYTASRSLSRTISGAAETAGDTFPFVTLPHFEMYGGEARKLANADLMAYVPLVRDTNLKAWETYSQENQGWVLEGLKHQGESEGTNPGEIPETLHTREETGHDHEEPEVHLEGYHFPLWQMASAPRNASIVNLDMSSDNAVFEHDVVDVIQQRKPLLSSIQDLEYLTQFSLPKETVDGEDAAEQLNLSIKILRPMATSSQPQQSYILQPIFDSIEAYTDDDDDATATVTTADTKERATSLTSGLVGFVVAVIDWKTLFSEILTPDVAGITVVVNDGCGHVVTYAVNGPEAFYKGKGDQHDEIYDSLILTVEDFGGLVAAGFEGVSELHPVVNGTDYNERYEGSIGGHCAYTLSLYSSDTFNSVYSSRSHVIPAGVIGIMVLFIMMSLCFYDCITTRRQARLLAVARQTNNLISSLFPKDVQRRIFEEAAADSKPKIVEAEDFDDALGDDSQAELEGLMEKKRRKKAIADYFPNATIFFGDIVGFTAWSSTRDPSQVFQLLETIYHAFDEIAKRRRVFKVETVGDCYVAATGLPEARSDHAVVMARFARDCVKEFGLLVRRMEETLGPDTGDLGIRVGLNSGPVTAGVLRGERSRFQLFGDTVNTAARMESNGAKDKIHISQETAEFLIQAGKKKWVSPRADKIVAKGKGELQTYWLEVRRSSSRAGSSTARSSIPTSQSASENGDDHMDDPDEPSKFLKTLGHPDKLGRLVKWNTELLAQSLQLIVARRIDGGSHFSPSKEMRSLEEKSRVAARNGKLVLDEVVEVIDLPQKTLKLAPGEDPTDPDTVQLTEEVITQLHDFVRTIAAMYRNNPFHNFEHASHVTMSTSKLLARIVAPEETTGGFAMRQNLIDEEYSFTTGILRDTTYGITSDPLTQFASVFVALIHDVDHPGVPNSTLVKEGTSMAATYQNRSVAEQNSIDLAWDLFMDPAYEELRRVLYCNQEEFERFRQLVANLVMATDIMDKELGAFRKARWNKVFSDDGDESRMSSDDDLDKHDDVNRKATIVLEHLIQASDVSHTMQHWHIFVKWNERLFHEMYRAYREGRADTDPSTNWYKSEIGFFDFYIIPLAKKLESCGVFGVSSDEYLAYATQNRNEWEARGQEYVAMYLEKHNEQMQAMAELDSDSKHIVKEAEEVAKEAQVEKYVKNILGLLGHKQAPKEIVTQEDENGEDEGEFGEEAEADNGETKEPDEEARMDASRRMSSSAFYFN